MLKWKAGEVVACEDIAQPVDTNKQMVIRAASQALQNALETSVAPEAGAIYCSG